MKMDTVWQAKVADSAIEIGQVTVTLDVAGAENKLDWALGVSIADWAKWAFGQQVKESKRVKAQIDF